MKTNNDNNEPTLYASVRCRAFDGALTAHDVSVTARGTLRVWDPIAKAYTVHHGLSPAQERRALRIARDTWTHAAV
jgi:hypothetical protein